MPDAGRQRETVSADGVAQKLGESGLVGVGEIGSHAGGSCSAREPKHGAGAADSVVQGPARIHRVEPDIGELVERHGTGTTVIDWAHRLRCSACGARAADFVVSGARR